jgi:hypothetical protein
VEFPLAEYSKPKYIAYKFSDETSKGKGPLGGPRVRTRTLPTANVDLQISPQKMLGGREFYLFICGIYT